MTYQQLIQRSVRHRMEQKAIKEALLETQLKPSDFMVLALIHEGSHNATSISKLLDASMAYVTNRINDLADAKWVQRSVGDDNRMKHVTFIGDEAKFQKAIEALAKVDV